jgi:hypothetical protein
VDSTSSSPERGRHPLHARAGKLTNEDLMLRRAIVATGSLRLAASLLGWPPSRLSERMRRNKQSGWWQALKSQWALERRRERGRRARRRRRERQLFGPP